MKKIIAICIALILVIAVALYWWYTKSQPQNAQDQSQTGFPTSASNNGEGNLSTSIQTLNSGTVNTKNFLADSETKEDRSNTGYYFLGNQPESPHSYVIVYIAETNYFNISLLQEPIRDARTDAEAYLLEHLGISKEQLCTLNYMVSTPDSVNNVFSGTNLGFSFCPNSVKLP